MERDCDNSVKQRFLHRRLVHHGVDGGRDGVQIAELQVLDGDVRAAKIPLGQ